MSEQPPGRPDPLDPIRWHPPAAVLELAELVVTGALDRLPALDGFRSPADVARDVDLEDAEGTPVARLDAAGMLTPLAPFAHGPLRGARLAPAEVRAGVAGTGAILDGPLTGSQVERLRDLTARQAADGTSGSLGPATAWFVLFGASRPAPLAPEALLAAVRALAADTPGALPVPLAVPLLAGVDPTHDGELVTRAARGYGVGHLLDLGAGHEQGTDPVHPAFAPAAGAHLRRGVAVLFTGLSGSGKSTVARRLAERILTAGDRPVTLLDGDEVRRLLSAGLGFSRADRDLNVRRIGFVAAEIARHGGLTLAAPIAPFDAVRREVRAMVADAGGEMVLVHVATPLAECERRDRKGLYARARRGEVADFTGISSPYEPPEDADLVIDTTGRDVDACVEQVHALLRAHGHLPPQAMVTAGTA